MENKNLQQMELELIDFLLGVVNSKEEWEYLKAEEARLLSSLSYTDERRCSK